MWLDFISFQLKKEFSKIITTDTTSNSNITLVTIFEKKELMKVMVKSITNSLMNSGCIQNEVYCGYQYLKALR